jgi:hypothetical protein
MSQSERLTWTEHDQAYQAFINAILHPAKRAEARTDPLLQPVLEKLTDGDLDILKSVANNQSMSNHGDPSAPPLA